MEQCLRADPWMLVGKATFLKKLIPGMQLSKEMHKSFPIWINIFNVPVEFWSPMGLSWVASAIGKPVQLCSRTAIMEKVDVARICVEVDADASFPTRIVLKTSSDSSSVSASQCVVNVEYSWKPIRFGHCLLLGHEVSKCKSKRIFRPTGKILSNTFPTNLPSTGKAQGKRSIQIATSDGLHRVAVAADCPANPFAPLQADCDPDSSSAADVNVKGLYLPKKVNVKGLDVQCPQEANPVVCSAPPFADALEEAPASCSDHAAASLGLVAAVIVKEPSNYIGPATLMESLPIQQIKMAIEADVARGDDNSSNSLSPSMENPPPFGMILSDDMLISVHEACQPLRDATPNLATKPDGQNSVHVELGDALASHPACVKSSSMESAFMSCLFQQGGLGVDRHHAAFHSTSSYANVLNRRIHSYAACEAHPFFHLLLMWTVPLLLEEDIVMSRLLALQH